jgi:hypothetical protein
MRLVFAFTLAVLAASAMAEAKGLDVELDNWFMFNWLCLAFLVSGRLIVRGR